VIESEHGRFGKQAVVNANACLSILHVHQRHIRRAGFGDVKNGVAREERSARAVLAGEPNVVALEQQGTEREKFRIMPFEFTVLLKNFATMIKLDAFDLWLDVELFLHSR